MGRFVGAFALSLALAFANTSASRAAIDGPTVKRIKRATVFVSLGQHRKAGSGSGFLVHRDGERGLIVTNAHVVAKAPAGALQVVFNSGTRKADSIPAKVLGISRSRDLAVLEVEASKLPEPLSISSTASVYETQTVHIVGFPFGKGFATNRETPVVTISQGTVSSQRMDVNDQARLMQIDGDLNPGNSGGPIVNANGEVVGVAVATVRQTNIGFAIPLAPVVEMMAGTLTDLQGERAGKGVRVRARLLDPQQHFESARLKVRVMNEDKVLDLLDDDDRWHSIAPKSAGAPFKRTAQKGLADQWQATHELSESETPSGLSLVAQITVMSNGVERILPPFRVQTNAMSVALTGPDVRPAVDDEQSDADSANNTDKLATLSASETALDELFTRSGIAGLIAAMSEDNANTFDESPDDEDERTVKERLREIIASQWDEERIKRTWVRSFEAAPNADAQRRALELFDLPAMKLLHLTLDRIEPLTNNEVKALRKLSKGNPVAFEKRLDLMREIDAKRNFSQASIDAVVTSVTSLSRLLNEIRSPGRRMSADLLQRDVQRAVSQIELRIRSAIPIMLANQYYGVDEADLRDYLKQLDSIALRWFAEREHAAQVAVYKAQFSEAEDEIAELFKEVRRESLGLAEMPDLKGKNDVQVMDAVIQAYGKEAAINYVIERRGGEITVLDGRSMKSQFGRPRQDSVTAKTLAVDLKEMKLEARVFADELVRAIADQAAKDRRLTARGQSQRLMAALRARRVSKSAQRSRSLSQARAMRAQQSAQRAEQRECRKTCNTARLSCKKDDFDRYSACFRKAPRVGKARSRVMQRCQEERALRRESCRIQDAQCVDRC